MSSLPPFVDAELDRHFEAQLAKRRARNLQRFEAEPLAWLALAPAWTLSLARACGFPARSLEEFMDQTMALGYSAQAAGGGWSGRSDREFWMPETVRGDVLAHLQQLHGTRFLQQQAGKMADAVLAQEERRKRAALKGRKRDEEATADPGGLPATSPVMVQWAELAQRAAGETGDDAAWFRQEIEALLEPGCNDTGRALALTRTGELLASALGGPLQAAVQRARHRIELAYRRAQDERHLASFLPRQEQIEAFRAVMDGPDDVWALHYLGMGGVGKTMLIRQITAGKGLAAECHRLATRVDFDHLSPNYPVRQPELLLLALADELRVHSEPGLFARFQQYVDELHDALSEAPPAGDPLANLRRPAFAPVLRAFVDWVRALPQPPLFVLDTCEELAKFHPAVGLPPSIAATFEILERLHDELPQLRVVFAGRRPLALSGPGWEIDPDNLPEGKQYLPKQKAYLRLHEIRGFTEEEADRFVAGKFAAVRRAQREPRPLAPELRAAILQRSRESGTAIALRAPAGTGAEVGRYNPFDLALYTDWFLDDDTLTAEAIASGRTDPYVQRRIIERLEPLVREHLLPAAVLLYRFDKSMLRGAYPGGGSAFEDAFRALGEQEWIDYQPSEEMRTTFLEIDKKLYPRLRDYYSDPLRSGAAEAARARLGPALAKLIDQRPLAELGVDLVRAALRLLPLAEAAGLWNRLEARVVREAAWGWAAALLSRLLAEGERRERIDERLRPALLATHAAALLQQQPDDSLPNTWAEVAATAERHPLPEIAAQLRFRARAGAIAAARLRGEREPNRASAEETAGSALAELLAFAGGAHEPFAAEQIAGSLCAAAEGLVETKEPAGGMERVQALTASVDSLGSLELRACAAVWRARARRAAGKPEECRRELARALAWANEVPARTQPQWAEWRAPGSIRDRVRLEALCLLDPAEWPGAEILEAWTNAAVGQLDLVDSERLVSCLLQRQLAHRPVPAATLDALAAGERYEPGRLPTASCHRAVRPLFATLALARLALGQAQAALALINRRTTEAVRAGADVATVAVAREIKVQVIRRMRLANTERAMLAELGTAQEAAPGHEAPALVLNGFPVGEPSALAPVGVTGQAEVTRLHAWWRCQVARDAASAGPLREAMSRLEPAPPAGELRSAEDLALELDRQEWSALAGPWPDDPKVGWGVAIDVTPAADDGAASRREYPRREKFDPAADPRLELANRLRHALLRSAAEIPPFTVQAFGVRSAAELALEEGELLALRLPVAAERFLATAQTWFSEAGDSAGGFICAVARTTAAIVAGREEQARQLLDGQVRPAYEALLAADAAAALPGWEQLAAGARTLDSVALDALEHPSWGGWMQRLVRCLIWADPSGLEQNRRDLGAAFFDRIPRPVPAELVLTRQDARLAAAPLRKARPEKADLGIRLLVSGLSLFVLVVFGYWGLSASFAQLKLPEWLEPGSEHVFSAIGLMWFAYMVIAAFYWVRSFRLARRSLELQLSIPASAGGGLSTSDTPPVRISLASYGRRVGSLRASQREVRLERRAQAPGVRPYTEAKDLMPPEILDLLTLWQVKLTGRSWRHRVAVGLESAPALQGYAWEACFGLSLRVQKRRRLLWQCLIVLTRVIFGAATFVAMIGLPMEFLPFLFSMAGFWLVVPALLVWWVLLTSLYLAPWRLAGRELHFYRRGPLGPNGPDGREGWLRGEVRVICSATWNLLMENGWARVSSRVRTGDTLPAVEEQAPLRVLALLGHVVRTADGLYLQVAARGAGGSAPNPAELSRRSGQVLYPARALPHARAGIVVVQGEPEESTVGAASAPRPRTESSREQAALLRAYGAELFAAGAETVIVIPSLPPRLAQQVIQALAKRLRGPWYLPTSRPSFPRTLDAVSFARREILRAAERGQGNPGLEELAFDLCVFARTPDRSPAPESPPPA